MTARSYWKVLYWGSAPSITFIACISKSHFIQSLNYTGECLNCVCLCLSFFNLEYVKHTSFSLGLIKFSNSDSDFRFINLLMCQSSRLGFRVFKVQIIRLMSSVSEIRIHSSAFIPAQIFKVLVHITSTFACVHTHVCYLDSDTRTLNIETEWLGERSFCLVDLPLPHLQVIMFTHPWESHPSRNLFHLY